MPQSEVYFGDDFPGNDALDIAEYEKKIMELEGRLSEADTRSRVLLEQQRDEFARQISKAQDAGADAHEEVVKLKRRIKRDRSKENEKIQKYHETLKNLREQCDDAVTELCDRDEEADEFRKIIRQIEEASLDALTRYLTQAQVNERRWVVAMAALRLIYSQVSKGYITHSVEPGIANILLAVKKWVELPPMPMWDDPSEIEPFEDEAAFLKGHFKVGGRTMEFELPPEGEEAPTVEGGPTLVGGTTIE